jgi:methylmalonyl-CoA/ethylmalonyl-CoA epimerase
MPGIEQLRMDIELPPPSQIGVVVRDIDRAARYYSSVFGIGPFTVYEWSPDRHWILEKPSHLKLKMGKSMWGSFEFELIEPLEGNSLHREFLENSGEGLHHLGFHVRDYDYLFGKFLSKGFIPLMRAESYVSAYNGHLKACYFDTRQTGGIIFEIIWKSWLQVPETGIEESARNEV